MHAVGAVHFEVLKFFVQKSWKILDEFLNDLRLFPTVMKKHGKMHKIFADYLVFSKDREIFKVHFYRKTI